MLGPRRKGNRYPFDPMDVSTLFHQMLCTCLEEKRLRECREMEMERIAEAHELIQSGKSGGKVVMRMN